MLVVLVSIEENAKGTISKCSLACNIFLLDYYTTTIIVNIIPLVIYFLRIGSREFWNSACGKTHAYRHKEVKSSKINDNTFFTRD